MKRAAILLASVFALPACSPSPPAVDAAPDVTPDAADVIEDTGPVAQPVTVMTTRGGVTGRDFGTHAAFLGIPYAASTAGANRWRPPAARDAWTAPLDVVTQPDACPQNPDGPGGPLLTSEDCLKVNVWTPSIAPATPRPVMVFVHGGGFTTGEIRNPLYEGANLSRHGVVVVSMSYRLGQLGWLAHPALVAEDTQHHAAGNYGFMDQQAALRWVQANIARFGGDPANVTLFGESAGAISVCGHLVSPQSDGLLQRAIAESGSCAFIYLPLHDVPGGPYESAEALGARFATAVGCDTATDPLACMRARPVADVLAAARAPLNLRSTAARYFPVVDGHVFP
ncbi:MAG: carboxylesterase family protein, partial [Deltaproteobacteria bacterium]